MNSGSIGPSKILMFFGLIVLFGILLLFIFNKLTQEKGYQMTSQELNSELIGESKSLILSGNQLSTQIALDTDIMESLSDKLLDSADSDINHQVFLNIENVKGTMDATILEVKVNDQTADHVSFFGLRKASEKSGDNEGMGLSFNFDITDIIRNHSRENDGNLNMIDIRLIPSNSVSEENAVAISKLSIYRIQQKR